MGRKNIMESRFGKWEVMELVQNLLHGGFGIIGNEHQNVATGILGRLIHYMVFTGYSM
jgi:hypothetical protein